MCIPDHSRNEMEFTMNPLDQFSRTQKANLLQKIIESSKIETNCNRKNLDLIAQIVDLSWDLKNADGAKYAQKLASELSNAELSKSERSELFYFIANSWAALRDAQNPESRKSFDWEIEEVEKELIFLRKSAYHDGFDQLQLGRQCQILTNLAGRLSEIGRPVEALLYWDEALTKAQSFGMAHGNRGIGIWKYGHHLYDQGHEALFLLEAEEALKKSCKSDSTDPEALLYFKGELERIPKMKSSSLKNKEFKLGDSVEEISYRKWCLENRLFLNPLNDITANSIAATDVFALPSITTRTPEMPLYFSRFNLMKQEYIAARHLMYLSQVSDDPHYADKSVSLVNTLDYQLYSVRIEYVKMVFRSAYSILDKVAFFLNDYFELQLDEKKIYFRSVWYKNGNKQSGLNSKFKESKNWSLRGLFWLSKDIFENNAEFKEAIAPDAQQLLDIRNHLEHKYVTLHDSLVQFTQRELSSKEGIIPLSFEDFYRKTVFLLKLSRSAILYLSMAVHVEEERKRHSNDENKIAAAISLTNVEHEWKRTWRN